MADMESDMIKVEVAYALPHKQMLIPLSIKKGSTVYDAAVESGVADKFPDIDLETIPMGIFGKAERKPKERVLNEGERVELYRPLIADPKEVRKRRAEEIKAKRESE